MGSFWRVIVQSSILLIGAGAAAAAAKEPPGSTGTEEGPPAAPADDSQYPNYFDDGDNIEFASMLWQQPGGQPGAAVPQPAPRRYATGGRQAGNRLASVPNMFGDCGMTTGTVSILQANGGITDAQFMLPMVGGARTAKIAENDVALPVDRIFFNYNHYANIFEMQEQQVFPPGPPALFRTEPLDRYTIGVEKTFLDQLASVELRMPFNGSFDANLQTIGVSNGNVGNLAVLFKGSLYQDDSLGIGVGVGIDVPTGSDTVARLGDVNLQFRNDAVHLLPFIGFLYSAGDPQWGWGDGLFLTGFFQVDVAANGNRIQFADPNTGAQTELGKFNEQNVLYMDLAVGYWLYRDPYADRLTGLAIVNEYHYTTSIQDADLVAGTANGVGAVVTNTENRFDVVNATIALQALLFDASSLRVGGVFPIGQDQDQRFFDGELQVQFNRRF